MNYEGLWPHQRRGLEELVSLIEAGEKRICVTSPTGGGKTRMLMTRILANKDATIYTDRKMLFSQLCNNLDDAGLWYGKRASGHKTFSMPDTQICMIQTEKAAVMEYGARDIHNSSEIHIDEAHNNSRGKSLELMEMHSGVKIGWTATPLDLGHAFDHLVVAGTNSELRECGSHIPAYHFAPSEGGVSVVGKVKVGEGVCGISKKWRTIYCQRIFGGVLSNLRRLNPELKPTILFGPDVAGSIWFCEQLNEAGIAAAHIDGENCWLDGSLVPTTQEVREEIADRHSKGEIKVVCNRFVLREGVDWPWIAHCIFATNFGSVTAYIQAGGRVLRNHPSLDHVTIQDHGGNWHVHGSLNENRLWDLGLTNATYTAMRHEMAREDDEGKSMTCPKCDGIRGSGLKCPFCGWEMERHDYRRKVIEVDGTLKPMEVSQWRKRKKLATTEKLQREWTGIVYGTRKYKPERTMAQLYANFARNHDWQYPPKDWPQMPKRMVDWYLPIRDLRQDDLYQKGD